MRTLSFHWQKDSVESPNLLASEKTLRESLQCLKKGQDDQDTDLRFLSGSGTVINKQDLGESAETQFSSVTFKGVKLHDAHLNVFTKFKQLRKDYIRCVENCLEDRFCFNTDSQSSTHDLIFNCTTVLDTRLWPVESGQLRDYGNEKVKKAGEHFQAILSQGVQSEAELINEWIEMKVFISDNFIQSQTHGDQKLPSQIWQTMHQSYSHRYPHVCEIINIMRVFPFSNAIVERGFSVMNRIKTDWRASLNTCTLDNLIRIKKLTLK